MSQKDYLHFFYVLVADFPGGFHILQIVSLEFFEKKTNCSSRYCFCFVDSNSCDSHLNWYSWSKMVASDWIFCYGSFLRFVVTLHIKSFVDNNIFIWCSLFCGCRWYWWIYLHTRGFLFIFQFVYFNLFISMALVSVIFCFFVLCKKKNNYVYFDH